MSDRTKAYLALTAVAFIWGTATVVIKYTLDYLPPFTFLTYRFWISFVIILPFLIYELNKVRRTFNQIGEVVLLNIIGIPLTLILVFIGIQHTSALEASFILATAPVFNVLAGYLFLKEKIETHELLGISIALVGTIAIVIEPLFNGKSFVLSHVTGNLILILSIIADAYYTVRSRRDLKHKYSPLFIIAIGFFVAPLILTPLSTLEQPLPHLLITIYQLPAQAHLGVWFMALFSGIIAYFLFQFGLKRIEASEATIFRYLNPIFSAPLAVFWLGDKITTPFLIGAVIIIIGVFIAEYRPHRRKHQIILSFLKELPQKILKT